MRTSILLTVVVLLVTAARAEDRGGVAHAPGISVIGVASAQVRPSTIEIAATLSAEAELANDARVKERDARQKLIDSMQTRNPGVALEFRGISLNPLFDVNAVAMARQQQIMIQNGMVVQMQQNQTDLPHRYGVTEQVRLVMRDTDKLETPKLIEAVAKLIDNARDSGLQVGQINMNGIANYSASPSVPAPPLIVCKAANSAAVRGQAYKDAIEDARTKASLLAELSGVKIGKVISVVEMEVSAGGSASGPMPASTPDSGFSSVLLGELTLSVRLDVQFEIVN